MLSFDSTFLFPQYKKFSRCKSPYNGFPAPLTWSDASPAHFSEKLIFVFCCCCFLFVCLFHQRFSPVTSVSINHRWGFPCVLTYTQTFPHDTSFVYKLQVRCFFLKGSCKCRTLLQVILTSFSEMMLRIRLLFSSPRFHHHVVSSPFLPCQPYILMGQRKDSVLFSSPFQNGLLHL